MENNIMPSQEVPVIDRLLFIYMYYDINDLWETLLLAIVAVQVQVTKRQYFLNKWYIHICKYTADL